jgi:Protein of unknown function (DUF1501)
MDGGPSQLETFDVKPGSVNGGPSREIATNVSGIRISEHLPQVARHMNRMAILRSMSTRVADHGLGAYLMHTGHGNGPVNYPAMGALFAKELQAPRLELPPFISIAPRAVSSPSYGSGFLEPQFAPLVLAEGGWCRVMRCLDSDPRMLTFNNSAFRTRSAPPASALTEIGRACNCSRRWTPIS